MIAVGSLLVVLSLSLLIIRIGTIALVMTGLSEDVARFQSLSAFSGAGYTTTESESIVSHPARRRVAMFLIRTGSVGVVTSIATLLLSFIGAGEAAMERLFVLILGAAVVIGLAKSRIFNRMLTPIIKRILERYSSLDLKDYADLLSLREDYRIVEIDVKKDTWLADRVLKELDLIEEGVLVLGIEQADGEYIGAPPADLRITDGDRLLLYGKEHRLKELSKRQEGDQAAHRSAKSEHQSDLDKQGRQLKRE